MAERKLPAPFLIKTYQLVDDPATDDVVSWNETGTTFVVWKTADFARDLLPNYFKHCNFSSFVRQLNTYGFRKIVADKWEFANENFRRGEQILLAQMRRRKTVPGASGKPATTNINPTSPINSGDNDQAGSSSTSSPDSKNPGSLDTPSAAQFANLSDENEKLRTENQTLSSELTQMKKQCDELIAFLTKYVNVGPDQINNIMRNGIIINSGSNNCNGVSGELTLNNWNNDDDDKLRNNGRNDDDDDEDDDEDDQGLKIFGVLLKGKKNKKRGRDEINNDFEGPHGKDIKILDDHKAAWLHISSGEGNKVCN